MARAVALRTSVLVLVVAWIAVVGAACPAAGRDDIASDIAAAGEAETSEIATNDGGVLVSGITGPSSTPGQLMTDSQNDDGAVSNETLDDALDRYFDFKARVADETGLLIGTEYTMLAQGGGPPVGDDQFAASGRWALFGAWTLVDRSGSMAGDLVFRVENRHTLGTPLAPGSLNQSLGVNQSTAVAFNDGRWLLTNLYWHQRFWNGKLSFLVGQLDPTDYVDTYPLVSPWTTFMNGAFGNSPTIAMPNQTLGLAIGALPHEHVYLVGGVADPDGNPNQPFDTFFDGGDVFVSAEIGWVGSMEKRHEDNIHLTGWYASERLDQGVGSGWGLNFSGSRRFSEIWTPFARGGFAVGDATTAKGYVAAGLGLAARGDDLFGVGLAWTRPANGARDQYTAEIFYRVQILRNLALTPDLQIVLNPQGRSAGSAVAVAGLRLRVNL